MFVHGTREALGRVKCDTGIFGTGWLQGTAQQVILAIANMVARIA